MAARKIWIVYEVGASQPLTEIEAQFERTALDHAAAIHGVKRDKLYAVPRGLAAKGKRPQYVLLAWSLTADQEPDPGRRYQEASYLESEVPGILARLRDRGVQVVSVNDHEVAL
jgi:hypothetical protein